MAIVPQTQSFKLYGAGASVGATSITLQSFKNLDLTNLTMTHFGGSKGFLTIEPSSGTQEEQISFASITNNANGTVTLGTIKTVLNYTPFTETAGLAKTHGGNVEVIVSNTSGFYNNIVAGTTASQIINVPAGFIAATDVQGAINELDTEVLHKAGTETATGIKTFTETAMPRISATHTYIVGEEEFLATKRYTDSVAGTAVGANASTTVKGIVEEATNAEVLASATTGGTGARLYVNPGDVGNSANKIPFVTSTGKLATTIIPNLKFGGTGADSALSISSGVTNIDLAGAQLVIKNYPSISITGTASVTFTNPHANGTTIIFKSQGNVTLTSSAVALIDASGMGSKGGVGYTSLCFGGDGGGALYIECAGALTFSGTIKSNGTNAITNASSAAISTSAGGGAGSVLILANTITTNTGTVTTTNGANSSNGGGACGGNLAGGNGNEVYGLYNSCTGARGGGQAINGVLSVNWLLSPYSKIPQIMPGGGGGAAGVSYCSAADSQASPSKGINYVGLNTEFV